MSSIPSNCFEVLFSCTPLLTTCETRKLADCRKLFDLLSVIRRNIIEKFDLFYLTPSSLDCMEFVHYSKNDVEDESENQLDLY